MQVSINVTKFTFVVFVDQINFQPLKGIVCFYVLSDRADTILIAYMLGYLSRVEAFVGSNQMNHLSKLSSERRTYVTYH